MKTGLIVLVTAGILSASGTNETQTIVNEVAKLRLKYEECRAGQKIVQGTDPREFNAIRTQYEQLLLENKKLQTKVAVLEKRYNDAQAKITYLDQANRSTAVGNRAAATASTTADKIPSLPSKAPVVLHAPVAPSATLTVTPKRSAFEKPEQPAPASAGKVTMAVKKNSFAYRIAGEGKIYDGPEGSSITQWENGRSFTASESQNGWIRVSGYFVNRVWQPCAAEEQFWIRESDTQRR